MPPSPSDSSAAAERSGLPSTPRRPQETSRLRSSARPLARTSSPAGGCPARTADCSFRPRQAALLDRIPVSIRPATVDRPTCPPDTMPPLAAPPPPETQAVPTVASLHPRATPLARRLYHPWAPTMTCSRTRRTRARHMWAPPRAH